MLQITYHEKIQLNLTEIEKKSDVKLNHAFVFRESFKHWIKSVKKYF